MPNKSYLNKQEKKKLNVENLKTLWVIFKWVKLKFFK